MKTLIVFGALAISSVSYGQACPNFTGTWSGSCTTSEGRTIQRTLAVSQSGCSAITVKNKQFTIGQVRTADSQFEGLRGTSSESYTWSTDQETLLHAKSVQLAGPGKILTTTHTATWKLVNGQLHADSASRGMTLNGANLEEAGGTDACVLSK